MHPGHSITPAHFRCKRPTAYPNTRARASNCKRINPHVHLCVSRTQTTSPSLIRTSTKERIGVSCTRSYGLLRRSNGQNVVYSLNTARRVLCPGCGKTVYFLFCGHSTPQKAKRPHERSSAQTCKNTGQDSYTTTYYSTYLLRKRALRKKASAEIYSENSNFTYGYRQFR